MPGKVKVKITAGRNLPIMDRSNDTTDAYVEVKLGNRSHKTDVCRKSLNPVWNSEWFRFEMDDLELQDEPLQIRLMDYDTYSANDAIGKVYLDLNPLLNNTSKEGSIISGWIPVYDTMHGIRGEVNLTVKVELFTDLNKYRQSSCGVKFFFTQSIPEGFYAHAIHGFVEELVVNDDPEYQWIDKIRTPRASNEARQTLFSKLSGEVQRRIGLKALELGGNAVIGYRQCFDLEGDSGIVVRGIGTSVTITKQYESQLSPGPLDSTKEYESSSLDGLHKKHVHKRKAKKFRKSQKKEGRGTPSSMNPLDDSDFSKQLHDQEHTDQEFKVSSSAASSSNPPAIIPDLNINTKIILSSGPQGGAFLLEHDSTLHTNTLHESSINSNSNNNNNNASYTFYLPIDKFEEEEDFEDEVKVKEKYNIKESNNEDEKDEEEGERRGEEIVYLELKKEIKRKKVNSLSAPIVHIRMRKESFQPIENIKIGFLSKKSQSLDPNKKTLSKIIRAKKKKFFSNKKGSSLQFRRPSSIGVNELLEDIKLQEKPQQKPQRGLFSFIKNKRQPQEINEDDDENLSDEEDEGTSSSSKLTAARIKKFLTKRRTNKAPSLNKDVESFDEASLQSFPSIFSEAYLNEDSIALYDSTSNSNNDNSSFDFRSRTVSTLSSESSPRLLYNSMKSKLKSSSQPLVAPSPSSSSSKSVPMPLKNKFSSQISSSSNFNTSADCCENENAFIEPSLLSHSQLHFSSNKLEKKENFQMSEACVASKCRHFSGESNKSRISDVIEIKDQISIYSGHTSSEFIDNNNFKDMPKKEGLRKHNSNNIDKDNSINRNRSSKESSNSSSSSSSGKLALTNWFSSRGKKLRRQFKLSSFGFNSSTANSSSSPSIAQESSPKPPHCSYSHNNKSGSEGSGSEKRNSKLVGVNFLENSVVRWGVDEDDEKNVHDFEHSSIRCPIPEEMSEKSSSPHLLQSQSNQKNINTIKTGTSSTIASGLINSAAACDITNNTVPPTSLITTTTTTTTNNATAPNNNDNTITTLTASVNKINLGSGDPPTCTSPQPKANQSPFNNQSFNSSSINQTLQTVPTPPTTSCRRSSESDLSTPPKASILNPPINIHGKMLMASAHRPAISADCFEMLEYPFLTFRQWPQGGGTVTARSVKLLDRMANEDEPQSRDGCWMELRMEIRSHARSIGCNVIIGYEEHTTLCEDVCVLSASGTAAIISVTFDNQIDPEKKNLKFLNKEGSSARLDSCSSQSTNGFKIKEGKIRHSSDSSDYGCSLCHIPYSELSVPFPVKMSKCFLCKKGRVPDMLIATVDFPPWLQTTGKSTFIQAQVFRSKKDGKGETSAREISDSLPFLEYELHRRLINKLKVLGMNAIFALDVTLTMGEKMMVAVGSGTALFLTALPAPHIPIITAGNLNCDSQKVMQFQKVIQDANDKNRELFNIRNTNIPPSSNGRGTSISVSGPGPELEYESDEDSRSMTLDLDTGNKDAYILEVDDAEDIDIISGLIDPSPCLGMYMNNLEYPHGFQGFRVVCQQMFTQVWRCRISTLTIRQFSMLFDQLIRSVHYKLRKLQPFIINKMRFRVELPEQDEMQISLNGLAVGISDKMFIPTVILDKTTYAISDIALLGLHNDTPNEDSKGSLRSRTNSTNSSIALSMSSLQTQIPKNSSIIAKPSSYSLISNQAKPSFRGSNSKIRYSIVEITPCSQISGSKIEKYFGNLNFFFIRETMSIKECGGLSGFVQNFIAEILAIVRAHVAALGGNAMVSYFMTELSLLHNPHKNQGQCLINVGGDVVLVNYPHINTEETP